MRRFGLVLSLLLLVAGAANAQPKLDPKVIDRLMTDTLREWRIPGGALAIVRDDKVVYLKGYGVRELGKEGAVTPDTAFQIASLSKAFTAASMAMLVDHKKLAWDDRLGQYVDEIRIDDPCVDSMLTLRDAVSHRTGLARHDELWDNSPWNRAEVLEKIGHVEMARSFRSGYGYHNIMFIAAGEAVANASGISWDEFVRMRIFEPLGMKSTFTADDQWARVEHAEGYRWDPRGNRIYLQAPIDTSTLGPAGATKSTARDMANWVRFQLANGMFDGKRLVSEEALGETKSPQTVVRLNRLSQPESNLQSYGMGWNIQDYKGALLVSHSGGLNGFRSHLDLLPNQNAGFIIMVNAGRDTALLALRNSLADLLLGKPARNWNEYYLDYDRRNWEREENALASREDQRQPNTQTSRELASYAGTYESASHGTAKIVQEEDRLVLRWSNLVVPLTHWHYDTFHAYDEPNWLDELLTFSLDANGKVNKLTIFRQDFVRK